MTACRRELLVPGQELALQQLQILPIPFRGGELAVGGGLANSSGRLGVTRRSVPSTTERGRCVDRLSTHRQHVCSWCLVPYGEWRVHRVEAEAPAPSFPTSWTRLPCHGEGPAGGQKWQIDPSILRLVPALGVGLSPRSTTAGRTGPAHSPGPIRPTTPATAEVRTCFFFARNKPAIVTNQDKLFLIWTTHGDASCWTSFDCLKSWLH